MVELYSTALCGYCTLAKQLLERKAIPFTEIRVDLDLEKRLDMLTRSGRRSVPQIFIDGRWVGGNEELRRMDAAGELDRLMEARNQ